MTTASKLNKLAKVSESITINRYDNGWMVEIGGRDKKEDWKTSKTLCNTEAELLDLIREYNTMDLDV
jgi:glycine cleavage system H lipoate-binding protein